MMPNQRSTISRPSAPVGAPASSGGNVAASAPANVWGQKPGRSAVSSLVASKLGAASATTSVWGSRATGASSAVSVGLGAASTPAVEDEPLFPPLTPASSVPNPLPATYSTLASKKAAAEPVIAQSDFPSLNDASSVLLPAQGAGTSSQSPVGTQAMPNGPYAAGGQPGSKDSFSQIHMSAGGSTQSSPFYQAAGGAPSGPDQDGASARRKASSTVRPEPSVLAHGTTGVHGPSSHAGGSGFLRPDYTLTGLLDVIRMTDPDLTTLALGMDLASLDLDLTSGEPLYMSFISPWGDASGRIDQLLPPCYTMPQPPPLLHQRLPQLSDESLLYLFYALPGWPADAGAPALEEALLSELCRREWRWHKELHQWVIREAVLIAKAAMIGAAAASGAGGAAGTSTSSGAPAGTSLRPAVSPPSSGPTVYILFDPSRWERLKRELVVTPDQLVNFYEERPSDAEHPAVVYAKAS